MERGSITGQPELDEQLKRYAHMLIVSAANVQPGMQLVINCPVERADFARLCVREAYEAGAKHVTMIFADEQISRMVYEYEPAEAFETVPEWSALRLNSLAQEGATFLHLIGEDPMIMKGIDPVKPMNARRASHKACAAYRRGIDFGENAWSIAGVATVAWARAVYPDLPEDEAVLELWKAILATSRADGDDPVAAWEAHRQTFDARKEQLNSARFTALHYTSANGTDLLVGLDPGHVWKGGGDETVDGRFFFPNVPTEEVFTTPHCDQADGIVYATLPLVHGGNIINNFWIKFEQGKVVDFDAQEGKDVLASIFETDDGAKQLGEVALIPKESPINQLGYLFYNTLYDENASCHLALGMGYVDAYEGGTSMDEETLRACGVNRSATHVDFMIGADDLDIVGITASGERVPVFSQGTWA